MVITSFHKSNILAVIFREFVMVCRMDTCVYATEQPESDRKTLKPYKCINVGFKTQSLKRKKERKLNPTSFPKGDGGCQICKGGKAFVSAAFALTAPRSPLFLS